MFLHCALKTFEEGKWRTKEVTGLKKIIPTSEEPYLRVMRLRNGGKKVQQRRDTGAERGFWLRYPKNSSADRWSDLTE